VYDAGSGVLPLSKADARAAEQLWEELDAACSGWLRAARSLLQQLSSSDELLVTHVLVGNSQLVPLLGKLMLFKLDSAFDVCDVYSASSAAKMGCFRRIAEKYGPKARCVAAHGRSSVEQHSAQGWWLWRGSCVCCTACMLDCFGAS
jgi:hypothetical protein